MIRNVYKLGIVFLLSLFAQVVSVQAQYATGGTSPYRDQVLWITWGDGENGTHGQPLANGSTSSASITVADGQVLNFTFTIENATGNQLQSYRPGNWNGDILDDLYHIGGTGTTNQLISGISATNGIASFTIRATATLNDAPFPIKGFVMADAEAINTGVEYIEGTAAGSWYVVEMAKNIGAGQYIAVKDDNGDGTQTLRLGPGTDNGTAAVSFLSITNPAPEVTADFSIRGGGTTAIAIGLLAPNADFSDAPESYGGAMHLIPDLVFSPDNIPSDGVAVNLNTDDYNPGGLIAPTAGYLGGRGPDAEGGSPFSADALGDDQSGLYASEGDEEDAWPGANIYVEHAGSTLTRQIPCSGTGTVAGWIDFNRNGTFDADERAAAGCGVSVPGHAVLNWVIPTDIQRGLSFVRLRFASNANEVLSPTGVAEDGEVEDHAITIWQQEIVLVKEGEFNGPDQERAGGEVLYTFTLTNTGNVPLENIVVEDEKLNSQDVTIEWTVDGVPWNPSTGQLEGGQTAIGTAIYLLSQEEVDAGEVINQAYVSATPIVEGEWPATPIDDQPSDDPGPSGPDDPTVLPIPADPSLSIAKSTNFTGFASVGQLVEYFFTVTNTGNVTIENIEVHDPLLGGAIANANTDASAPWPATTGALAPGESVMLKAQYVVDEADVMGGTVVNTATVSGDDPSDPGERLDPVSSNSVTINMFDPCAISPTNPDSDGDGIADACDLDDDNDGILDSDECPYVPNSVMVVNTDQGELLEYNTATNTFVTLCSGITIEGGIVGDIAMDANGDIWGITNTNRLIKIDPNNCTVTDIVTDLGFGGNGLSFLPDGNLLAGGGGDALVRKIDVVGGTYTTSVWADFSSGYSNGDFIYIDGKVYVLWFDPSVNPTHPVLIEVTVDADYDYVSHTVLGTLPRYTWGLAKVNGNELYGVTGVGVDGYPNPEGTVVRIHIDPSFSWETTTSFHQRFNGATSSDEAVLECDTDGDGIPDRLDPDSDNDGCPDAVEYYGSLDAVGTDGGFYGEGNPPAVDAQGRVIGASYTGNYANVVIATQLGVVTSPDDVIANVGTEAVFAVEANALQTTQFENGNPDYTIPPANDVSAGLIYQWQLSVDGGSAWTNLTDSEQYEGTNTASLTITDVTIDLHAYQYRVEITHDAHICPVFSNAAVLTVPSADIAIEKEISNAAPDIGTDVTFTITVTNNGLDDATGVEVQDMLPSGYTYVNHSGAGTYDEATGVWTVGDLGVDEEASLTVVATVNEVGEYTNSAVVSAEEYDPTPENNEASVTPNPVATPSLSFVKTGVLSADGNTITYTFTVTNTGNVTMDDIIVSDPKIPAGVTVSPATLAPGEVATGTASYTVTQEEKDAGEVENLATVTGTPPTTDPDDPAEPIDPVPSTPDEDNPGTPGDPGVPTEVGIPANPALSLTKAATSEDPYGVGDYIKFEITVTNTGNVTLTDVTVTDDNAEIVSGSPIATLAPNGSATVIARYQVTQADIDAGRVVNQAKVTGDDPEGNPIPEVPSDNPDTPQPNDPTVVELTRQPSLSLTKRATGEGPYAVNQYINFELIVTNTGNVTLTDVTVTDDNAEIVSGSPIATLAPNGSATVIARHQVTQADIDAGRVVNQAKVTGDDPEGNPIPEVPSDNPDTPQPNDPTVVELTLQPSLSLAKRATGEGPYAVGDYINFEITVRNTGNVTLSDVVVTDDNAEIVSGSPVASLALNASASVIARHQVTQAEIDAGHVVNQAKVTGEDPKGNRTPEVPSDNPDTPEQPNDPTVVELTQQPSLSLAKRATGEGPYAVGQYINFELIVTNTGNVTLTDVTVTDDNAEIVSGSPVASLAPNASATVIARHQVTQADVDMGHVVNQAKVTGEDPEGNRTPEVPSDNPDTPEQPNDPTVVELTRQPGLTLTKRATGEGPYAVGDYINYELVVRNTGNVTLTDVAVTDDNAEVVSGSPIASLGPNASATVIARHRVTQADVDAGHVVNQAKVTGNDPDGNPIPEIPSDDPNTPEPNDPTVVEFQSRPGLFLSKGVTSEGPYEIGDYIKYFNIVVTNTGNVTLTDVVVTDDNADIISGSPIARLRPGESSVVMARHVVTQADVDAGQVVNQAKATGNDPEGNPTPEVLSDDPDTPEEGDETITPIAQTPGIRINKTADRSMVDLMGDRIVYTLQVTNTGNVTLRDVVINDPLTGLVHEIAFIRPGITHAHTLQTRYAVTANDLTAGSVTNTATVVARDPDGNPVSHSGSVTVITHLKVIEAENDDFGPVNGKDGGIAGNVLTNDSVDGRPLDPLEVTLTRLPSPEPSPLGMDEEGNVTVAPNTPAGTYTFDYQICDITNPGNCDIATVTVIVAPPVIEAEDDIVSGVTGYTGSNNVLNVFENDVINGRPIVREEVTLTIVTDNPALQLNPDGSVDVIPGTRGGTYTLEYRICEVLNPDNCSTATVTVTVTNPLKIPNVFTPNGDGNNDVFEIIGIEGFDRIELTIVNRWGNEVYRNTDYRNDWNGQGLTEGTYYYLITTHLGNTSEVHKGWVLIKRL